MTRLPLIFMAMLALLVLLAGVALARTSSRDGVHWMVLSGGGAPSESSSGRTTLNGTLGQTAIGPSVATHGSLGAGFWYGRTGAVYQVYLPLTLRDH